MDGANQVVWAIRYEPGSGWGAAASIDSMPTPSIGTRTSVDMDADGNAIALWGASNGTERAAGQGEVLWANRYVAGAGWETARTIKNGGHESPERAAEREPERRCPRGLGPVYRHRRGDAPRHLERPVHAWLRLGQATDWGQPGRIDDYEDGDKNEPDIAVDGMGVAHAVWSQDDQILTPDFVNIYANQYMPGTTPGSGWGTPALIEPPNEDPNEDADAGTPRVGVNKAGNAFVVWRQDWDNWSSIWSNRLDPDGTGWKTAERIENIDRTAKRPKVAVDDNRHAHAVWLHSFDLNIDWVRTNRFE